MSIKTKKLTILAILLTVLIFSGAACSNKLAPINTLINKFFNLLGEGNYGNAYTTLLSSSSMEKIAANEFMDKYTAIFDELEVTGITLGDIRVDENNIASFSLTYSTGKAGEITNDISVHAVYEGGAWKLAWTPAVIFPDMDWGDTVRSVTLKAARGEIFAGDTILAQNVGAVSVCVNTAMIENKNLIATQLSPLLNMTTSDILKKLDTTLTTVVLKQYLPTEIDSFTKQQLLLITGVSIDSGNYGTIRYYPQGSLLAHTLGYVGKISEEELAEAQKNTPGLYDGDAYVGKTGLEAKYESKLRGTDGFEIYIADSNGTKKTSINKEAAVDWLDIHLTIDFDLQKRAEEVLRVLLPDMAAAVVVLDPTTGAVQTIASNPTYDLNDFVRGISDEKWNALIASSGKPLFNHATSGLYPPGSIFKPFTASLALESGVLTKNTEFTQKITNDLWTPSGFGAWTYPAIKRIKLNNRPTPLNMRTAMITSDNIYFAYAALKSGQEGFIAYAESLGLGESIPFELSTAKSQLKNDDTEFNIKYLADSGYGQGEILFTPLQLAATFGAFANNGDIMQPYVVDAFYQANGTDYNSISKTSPLVWKSDVIDSGTITTINPMLEAVVKEGTGASLGNTGTRVAGKTGTAQVSADKTREIAWFAGFWIDENKPRLALVMIELEANSPYSAYRFTVIHEMLKADDEDN
jgi:penicillin-binding protein